MRYTGDVYKRQAQTTGRDELAGVTAAAVLCRPHLMLTNVGCDDEIVTAQLCTHLNDLVRMQAIVGILGLVAVSYTHLR